MPPSACRRGSTIPRLSTSRGGPADSGSAITGLSTRYPPQAGHFTVCASGAITAWHPLQIRSMAEAYQVRRRRRRFSRRLSRRFLPCHGNGWKTCLNDRLARDAQSAASARSCREETAAAGARFEWCSACAGEIRVAPIFVPSSFESTVNSP